MRLTVVTAVYNIVSAGRTEKLHRCLRSVHSQTCRSAIEHLVVDGASTDGTRGLLAEYEGKGWIRVISMPDHGVYEGMNNGLAEAKGEYVLFLNSDDCLHSPRAMEIALRTMAAHRADYGFGDVVVRDSEGRFDSYWIGSLNGLPYALNYCHQAMLVRTRILRAYGGFDLSYPVSADSHLMLRLYLDRLPCEHIKAFLADYALGGLSASCDARAHADHARAFYETIGKTCGLTEEECGALWHYKGIGSLSQKECSDIGRKLPDQNWRRVWASQMAAGRLHGMAKIYGRWSMSGWRGCLAAVMTKVRRIYEERVHG